MRMKWKLEVPGAVVAVMGVEVEGSIMAGSEDSCMLPGEWQHVSEKDLCSSWQSLLTGCDGAAMALSHHCNPGRKSHSCGANGKVPVDILGRVRGCQGSAAGDFCGLGQPWGCCRVVMAV